MSRLDIEILPILSDNYVYLLRDPAKGATAVVDPGVAGPVLTRLEEAGWGLDWILSTHHHQDHTGGNLELKQRTGCRIAGPAGERDAIPGIDVELAEGDRFPLGEAEAVILETPGHTRGHISYWFEGSSAVFCADTLFALGCGRVFEGTPPQMWASLQKLAALPPATRVYCGHEYTQSNARFAVTVDPQNSALARRAADVDRLRAAGRPTVPSTLGEELETNPFLRAGDPGIRRVLGMTDAPDADVFAEIRRRKDRF
ncbi:MAG TPA: hydroxyacylglutathione hydrolase [Thermoanaerobaculia bacterium]|nr:hydroxyacylglutathione hydrolase [Thermoanaerobaculia bacterium]